MRRLRGSCPPARSPVLRDVFVAVPGGRQRRRAGGVVIAGAGDDVRELPRPGVRLRLRRPARAGTTDPCATLIVRFKYRGEHHLRRALVGWLAEALLDPRIARRPADALVPVPLHPRRRRERGYNQAETCCRLLGRQVGLPVWPVLCRARYTGTQTLLSREERAKNLSGAFALAGGWMARRRKREIWGADLLLVDDVFTSGATVDACARVLLGAGAASVRVLTIARR